MIHVSIRSLARPKLFLILALAAAIAITIPPARSQDRATQDRIDRLERDLTMLQRQVYRGGPSQVPGAALGSAVDTELRMDRLETQMRELTGRVEDAVNGAEQLRRRIEQISSDIEVRFNQGQGPPKGAPSNSHAAIGVTDTSPAGPVAMRGPPPVVSPTPTPPPTPPRSSPSLMPPGRPVPPSRDPPPGIGSLTPPGPLPGTEPTNFAATGGLRPPNASAFHGGSASEQYNHAYGLLKQADYPAAEEAFKTFIGQHPDDSLAGSAQYWLGETFYVRGKYAEAASAFAEGYKRYPKGTKAADDLLKLGMSLARASQKQNACVALAQLDRDFANPGSAIKERAATEKKRLGC